MVPHDWGFPLSLSPPPPGPHVPAGSPLVCQAGARVPGLASGAGAADTALSLPLTPIPPAARRGQAAVPGSQIFTFLRPSVGLGADRGLDWSIAGDFWVAPLLLPCWRKGQAQAPSLRQATLGILGAVSLSPSPGRGCVCPPFLGPSPGGRLVGSQPSPAGCVGARARTAEQGLWAGVEWGWQCQASTLAPLLGQWGGSPGSVLLGAVGGPDVAPGAH